MSLSVDANEIPLFRTEFWDIRRLRRIWEIQAPIKIYHGEEGTFLHRQLDDDDDDDSSKSRMANATMELTSYIYTINIQLVTRFICMHREGKRTRPRESSSSSLEKNRKENHRVETKFFNSVLSPSILCITIETMVRYFMETPLYSFHQKLINTSTDWNENPFLSLAREIKLDIITRKERDHICNR